MQAARKRSFLLAMCILLAVMILALPFADMHHAGHECSNPFECDICQQYARRELLQFAVLVGMLFQLAYSVKRLLSDRDFHFVFHFPSLVCLHVQMND